jgi:hypothetical protein
LVGQLAPSSDGGITATLQISANLSYSGTDVAFHPTGEGTTTVTATHPDFDPSFAGSSVDVNVTQPGVSISHFGLGPRVGAGLQQPYQLILGTALHGGVTVRVATNNPSEVLLALDASTPGSSFIDIPIANNQTIGNFYVHGITPIAGDTVLTATQAQFAAGTLAVNTEAPVLRITELATSTTAVSANDTFTVTVGVRNPTSLFNPQSVRAGAGALTVTLTSSSPAVGLLLTPTVQIPEGLFYDLSAVFDPVSPGTTTITAHAPGFDVTFPQRSVTVTVSP